MKTILCFSLVSTSALFRACTNFNMWTTTPKTKWAWAKCRASTISQITMYLPSWSSRSSTQNSRSWSPEMEKWRQRTKHSRHTKAWKAYFWYRMPTIASDMTTATWLWIPAPTWRRWGPIRRWRRLEQAQVKQLRLCDPGIKESCQWRLQRYSSEDLALSRRGKHSRLLNWCSITRLLLKRTRDPTNSSQMERQYKARDNRWQLHSRVLNRVAWISKLWETVLRWINLKFMPELSKSPSPTRWTTAISNSARREVSSRISHMWGRAIKPSISNRRYFPRPR